MDETFIDRWPGKSPLVSGGPAHPAVYHMLDVAAVAERLIAPFGFVPPLRDALVLLTALHDLGKIGLPFRAMLETGATQVHGRHWEVTEALLGHHDAVLAEHLGSPKARRRKLYAATAGHHGRPSDRDDHGEKRMLRAAGDEALADAAAVIDVFASLWPEASLEGVDREETLALSWWLPGLVTAADWVGSNTDWFAPCPAGPSVAAYLDQARQKTGPALQAAGLESPAPCPDPLFSFALRPMQQACDQIALPDGPMLAVIEDETGAGKTEAALIMAQRMMMAGKGRGLFFALPTMATADAMFARATEIVGRMFAASPTLTLAHGRSGLSVPFRDLVSKGPALLDEPTSTAWLADNRRRALLADVGVGTIDQALLGILPTKFSTLRLFGLSSKILIVDEVHELGEPYLAEELATLLQAHAQAGGSAILLTATLPLEQRAQLMAAFETGAGRPAPLDPGPAYPALSIAGGETRQDFSQTPSARGPVLVERRDSAQAALSVLQKATAEGAACLWVRNAVDDAIAGVAALREAGVEADLLHARFALGDRKRHEAAVLERFGKTGQGREGRVLVATQVVESSLDLDFDVMVSDLAPMAALIQRAGRLWRHMDLRPAEARPVPAPVLYVVSPDPAKVEDARWLQNVLDRGAFTYPLDLQWRTADALFRTGRIEAPSGLRELIEAAHGAGVPVPTTLENAEIETMGKDMAAANQARQNVIDLSSDYRTAGAGAKDTDYPTRLGQEQRVLMLVRRGAGGLTPWAGGDGMPSVDSCQLSEVMASAHRLRGLDLPDQSTPDIAQLTADWPDWRKNTVIVCPVEEGGSICVGLSYDEGLGLLFDQ